MDEDKDSVVHGVECHLEKEVRSNHDRIVALESRMDYHDDQLDTLINKMDSLMVKLNDNMIVMAELRASRSSNLDLIEWVIPVFLTILTILLSRFFHL